MTRHVSAEKLARSRDGDLSRAAARRVAAHLAGCARCQADADALAGLPALLAGTQLPPMPDHLAARIETALVTESADRAAGSPARHPARAGPGRAGAGRRSGVPRWVVTDEQARRHARSSGPARRILATAAAVAVIGGGGYALVSGLGNGSSGSSSSASGSSAQNPAAGRPAAVPSAAGSSSGRNAPAASGTNGAFRPGVASPPDSGMVDSGPAEQYRRAGHTVRFTPVRTSTNYLAAQLGPQATATLAQVRASRPGLAGGSGSHSSSGQGPAGQGPASAFSAAALARLPGCVGRVAGGQAVLLVDLASFQGAPAIIIVTAPPGSAAGTQVWAVGAACSSSGADVLARRQLP
jgi:Putative zinc-finger